MTDTVIRVENLTKSYASFKALDDVSLAVPPGVIGLLGPNGAGKSTFIKCLLGLVRVSSGRGSKTDVRPGGDGL